jgi:hypothetical protein
VDDEPPLNQEDWIRMGVLCDYQAPRFWKIIQLTAVLPKCSGFVIDSDHVYDAFGDFLRLQKDRKLGTLMDIKYEDVPNDPRSRYNGTFMLFHQWIVPRQRAVKKKRKQPDT